MRKFRAPSASRSAVAFVADRFVDVEDPDDEPPALEGDGTLIILIGNVAHRSLSRPEHLDAGIQAVDHVGAEGRLVPGLHPTKGPCRLGREGLGSSWGVYAPTQRHLPRYLAT